MGDRSAGHGRRVSAGASTAAKRRARAPRGILLPLSTVPRFHAVTWLAWALAAVVIVQLASSPLYVTLVLAASALVASAHRISSTGAFRLLVFAGIVMALIRVVLTALTTHAVGTVLFTLPEATLPRILGGFTIGGTIEKEVVLQSLAEGYAIVALLGVFGAFNSVVSHHELLGSAPRAFHEAGLVVTIAAAFVPSTVASWQGAREADRARTGGIVRRRGRLARTVVPVLETGMERSLRLADSMDSRGFARHPPGPADTASAWGALLALTALAGSFVALVGRRSTLAAVLATTGAVVLVSAVVLASKASPRQRYRPRALTGEDLFIMATTALALALVAVAAAGGEDSLTWSASPLHSPDLAPLPAIGILLLAVPALLPTQPVAGPRIPDRHGPERRQDGPGGGDVSAVVTFAGVAFAYADEDPALVDIDLTVAAGEVLLVVGRVRIGQEHPAAGRERPRPPRHGRPLPRDGHRRRSQHPRPPPPRPGGRRRLRPPGPRGPVRRRRGRARHRLLAREPRHGARRHAPPGRGGARRPGHRPPAPPLPRHPLRW